MSLAEFKNAWNISDPQFSSIGSIAPPETLHHGSEPQRSRFLELERTSKRQQFELEKAAAQIRSLKDDKATLERQIQEIQYDPFSSLSLNAELQKKLAMQRVEISRLVATNDTLKTEFYKGRVRITELEALAQTRKEKVNEVEGERLKLAQALLSTQSKLAEVGLVVAEKEAELEVIKQKLAASDESKVNGSCSNCTMTGSLQESLTQQGRRLAEREAELERLKASLEREVHASIQKSNQISRERATNLETQQALHDLEAKLELTKSEKNVLMSQISDYMLLNEAHQRRLLSHARYLKAQSEKQIQTAQGNSKKTAILASQTNKAYQASLELMWILQIQLENEQVEHCQAELMYTDYVHHQSDFLTHLKQSHSLMTTKFSEFASSQKDNIDEAGYAALEELAGVLSATSLFSNDKITQLESALHAWKTTRKDMHGSHESEFSQNLAKLMECADIARNFLDGLSLTPGAKETGTSDISDAVEDSSDILDQSRPNSWSIDVPGNRRDSIDERDTVYDRIRTGIMGVTSYIPSINTVLRGTSAPELGDVSDPLSPSPQSTTMETPLALGKAAEPNRAFIRFVRKQERTITDLKSQIEELSAKTSFRSIDRKVETRRYEDASKANTALHRQNEELQHRITELEAQTAKKTVADAKLSPIGRASRPLLKKEDIVDQVSVLKAKIESLKEENVELRLLARHVRPTTKTKDAATTVQVIPLRVNTKNTMTSPLLLSPGSPYRSPSKPFQLTDSEETEQTLRTYILELEATLLQERTASTESLDPLNSELNISVRRMELLQSQNELLRREIDRLRTEPSSSIVQNLASSTNSSVTNIHLVHELESIQKKLLDIEEHTFQKQVASPSLPVDYSRTVATNDLITSFGEVKDMLAGIKSQIGDATAKTSSSPVLLSPALEVLSSDIISAAKAEMALEKVMDQAKIRKDQIHHDLDRQQSIEFTTTEIMRGISSHLPLSAGPRSLAKAYVATNTVQTQHTLVDSVFVQTEDIVEDMSSASDTLWDEIARLNKTIKTYQAEKKATSTKQKSMEKAFELFRSKVAQAVSLEGRSASQTDSSSQVQLRVDDQLLLGDLRKTLSSKDDEIYQLHLSLSQASGELKLSKAEAEAKVADVFRIIETLESELLQERRSFKTREKTVTRELCALQDLIKDLESEYEEKVASSIAKEAISRSQADLLQVRVEELEAQQQDIRGSYAKELHSLRQTYDEKLGSLSDLKSSADELYEEGLARVQSAAQIEVQMLVGREARLISELDQLHAKIQRMEQEKCDTDARLRETLHKKEQDYQHEIRSLKTKSIQDLNLASEKEKALADEKIVLEKELKALQENVKAGDQASLSRPTEPVRSAELEAMRNAFFQEIQILKDSEKLHSSSDLKSSADELYEEGLLRIQKAAQIEIQMHLEREARLRSELEKLHTRVQKVEHEKRDADARLWETLYQKEQDYQHEIRSLKTKSIQDLNFAFEKEKALADEKIALEKELRALQEYVKAGDQVPIGYVKNAELEAMKMTFFEEIQVLKNRESTLREELIRLNSKLELKGIPAPREVLNTVTWKEEPNQLAEEKTVLTERLANIELAMKELQRTHENAIGRLADSTKEAEMKELKASLLQEIHSSKTQEQMLRGELVRLSSKLDLIETSRDHTILDQQKSLADLLGGVESQVSKAISQMQEREIQLEQETQRILIEQRERQDSELKLAQRREAGLQMELTRLRETIDLANTARKQKESPEKTKLPDQDVSIISSTLKHIESLKQKMDSAQSDTIKEIKHAHELKLAETVRLMEKNISSLQESHAREIAALKELLEKETTLATHKQVELLAKIDGLQHSLSDARLDKLDVASSHAQELASRNTAHDSALSLLRGQQMEELSRMKQSLDSQRDEHIKVLAEINLQHANYVRDTIAEISLLNDQLGAFESAKSLAEEESTRLRVEIHEIRRILSELSELKDAEMQELVKQTDDIGQEKVLSMMNYSKQLELKCSGLHEALNKGHMHSVEVSRKNDILKVWLKQLKQKKSLVDVKNHVLESKIRLSSLKSSQPSTALQSSDDRHGLHSALQHVHAKIQSDRSRVETLAALLTGSHADSPFTMKLVACLIAVYDIFLSSWAATQKLVGQDLSNFDHRELIQTRHSLEAFHKDSVDFDLLFNLLHQQSIRSQLDLRRATEQATQESTKRLKRMIKSKQDVEAKKKTVSNTSSQTSWETNSVQIQAAPEPKTVKSVSTQVSVFISKRHSSSSQTPSFGYKLVEVQTETVHVGSNSAECQTDSSFRFAQNGFSETVPVDQSSRDSQTVMVGMVSQTSQTDLYSDPVRKSTKKSAISVINSQKETLMLELKQSQEESRLRLNELDKIYQYISSFCREIGDDGDISVNSPTAAHSALQKVAVAWKRRQTENLDLSTTSTTLSRSLRTSQVSLQSLSKLASAFSSGLDAINLSVISLAEKLNTLPVLVCDVIRDLKVFTGRVDHHPSVEEIERFFQKLAFLINHIRETERQERVVLEIKTQKNDSEISNLQSSVDALSRAVREKTKAVEIYDTIFSDFQQFLLSGSGQNDTSESMDSIVQVLRQALGASLGEGPASLGVPSGSEIGMGRSPITDVFNRVKAAMNRVKSVDHATESNLSCTVMEQLRLEMEKSGRLAECIARMVTLSKTLLEEVWEEIPAQVLWSVFKDRFTFLEESGSLDEAIDLTVDVKFSEEIKRLVGERLSEWEWDQKRKATVTVEETTQVTISFPPTAMLPEESDIMYRTPLIGEALEEQDSMMDLLDTDEMDREIADIRTQTKQSLAQTMGLLNNIYGRAPKNFSTQNATEDALADAIESAGMNFELDQMKKVTRMTLVETMNVVGRMKPDYDSSFYARSSSPRSPRIKSLSPVRSTTSSPKRRMLIRPESSSESEADIEAELAQMRNITNENMRNAHRSNGEHKRI